MQMSNRSNDREPTGEVMGYRVDVYSPGEVAFGDVRAVAEIHMEAFDKPGRTLEKKLLDYAHIWCSAKDGGDAGAQHEKLKAFPDYRLHALREQIKHSETGEIIETYPVACALSFRHTVAGKASTPDYDDCPFDVLALAGVACLKRCRGRQYGQAVVQSAFARVDSGEFDLSLFQTGVIGFYEKLNCLEVSNGFINSLGVPGSAGRDSAEKPWWEPHVAVYPSAAVDRGDWPADTVTVDLLGRGW